MIFQQIDVAAIVARSGARVVHGVMSKKEPLISPVNYTLRGIQPKDHAKQTRIERRRETIMDILKDVAPRRVKQNEIMLMLNCIGRSALSVDLRTLCDEGAIKCDPPGTSTYFRGRVYWIGR